MQNFTANLALSHVDIYEILLSLLFVVHNTPTKSCKIKNKEYFYILTFCYTDKLTKEQGDVGLHYMLRSKMSSWISQLAGSLFWVLTALV
jgi:hypothetical protein